MYFCNLAQPRQSVVHVFYVLFLSSYLFSHFSKRRSSVADLLSYVSGDGSLLDDSQLTPGLPSLRWGRVVTLSEEKMHHYGEGGEGPLDVLYYREPPPLLVALGVCLWSNGSGFSSWKACWSVFYKVPCMFVWLYCKSSRTWLPNKVSDVSILVWNIFNNFPLQVVLRRKCLLNS